MSIGGLSGHWGAIPLELELAHAEKIKLAHHQPPPPRPRVEKINEFWIYLYTKL